MLANVVTSAAIQRFGAPDDAQAARGTSYAQTCSPGWTPAFCGLLRGCRAAPAVGPTAEAVSCASALADRVQVYAVSLAEERSESGGTIAGTPPPDSPPIPADDLLKRHLERLGLAKEQDE